MKFGPFEFGRKPADLPTVEPTDVMKPLSADRAAELRSSALEAQSWELHNSEMLWRREQNWTSLTDPSAPGRGGEDARRNMVGKSRARYLRDPLYRRAVEVTGDFVLGRGAPLPSLASGYRKVLLDAETSGEKGAQMAESLQAMMREFWLNPWNRQALTAGPVQYRRFCDWQVDGELALLLQRVGSEFRVVVLDPLTITAVEQNPTAPGVPMLYKREYMVKGSQTRRYYWSQYARLDNEAKQTLEVSHEREWGRDDKMRPKDDEWLMLFTVGVEATAMRGTPPYWPIIPWSDSVNDLASMLRTYITALTQWAWSVKVKATEADIARRQANLGSKVDGTNPRPTGAAVRISGQGETLDPINITSQGGALFQHGFEVSRLMVCAGTGLPVYYLMGDPSTGNLATATAMELPVLKRFEHWQMLWTGLLDSVIAFIAAERGYELDTESLIELDLPDLDQRDAKGLLPALAQGVAAGFLPVEDAARIASWVLDAGNAEEMVERVKAMPTGQAGMSLADMMESDPHRALGLYQQVYEVVRRKTLDGAK